MKVGLYLDEISMQVLKKGLFVSCEPLERIEQISPGLTDERMSEIGQTYLVADLNKQILAKAKLVDAFVTTFGQPDSRLIQLIGYENQAEKFQKEYGSFYQKQFPDSKLNTDTELFVTVYKPVKDS